MSVISIGFMFFVTITALLYWMFPSKCRWIVLLVASAVFVWLANDMAVGPCALMMFMVVIAYFSACSFVKKRRKWVAFLTVIIEVGILVILKEKYFFERWIHISAIDYSFVKFITPIGISYFTLTLIGYVLDSYWDEKNVEKNFFKFSLFSSFFPIISSGPIVKYRETRIQLFEHHSFCYKTISFGCQRILWGIFKKLVISERLAILVDQIYEDHTTYSGLYVWTAVLLFVIRLYTDFSGCLDIVYGVSELFGISLPENFNLPFFSSSLAEFWRRWHITLGKWMKEYVFFPIMKSRLMQSINSKLCRMLGKSMGKTTSNSIGLLVLWFLIGFWHGGRTNFIAVTLWMWFVIVLSSFTQGYQNKLIKIARIKTNCFSWRLFQRVRTFVLFAIGVGFFPAHSFLDGIKFYYSGVSVFNPWIFFDGSFFEIGLASKDYNVLVMSVAVLFIVEMIKLKKISVREWLSNQNTFFRWWIWISLIVIVLIYGIYGPGYNAADFIYKGF